MLTLQGALAGRAGLRDGRGGIPPTSRRATARRAGGGAWPSTIQLAAAGPPCGRALPGRRDARRAPACAGQRLSPWAVHGPLKAVTGGQRRHLWTVGRCSSDPLPRPGTLVPKLLSWRSPTGDPAYSGGRARTGAGVVALPGCPDKVEGGPRGMVDVQRRPQDVNDRLFDDARGGMLTPRHVQVLDHPIRQSEFVVVDQDDAVRPPGAVLLVVQQESGEGPAQGRAAGPAEVVGHEPATESLVAMPTWLRM